jgi:hypothetical protein
MIKINIVFIKKNIIFKSFFCHKNKILIILISNQYNYFQKYI